MISFISSFTRQFILLLFAQKRNIIYVSEFASYHSWLPSVFGKIFGVPHIIFLHGADVNVISSIGYGHNGKWPLKYFNINSLRMASHLVPVSNHLVESDYTYIPNNPIKQGLLPLLNNVELNISVIPNGIDLEKFKNIGLHRKKRSFLVICSGAEQRKRSILKGLDLVKDLAYRMRSSSFTIVGYNGEKEASGYPDNVELYPNQASIDLVNFYNTHQFFLQLSLIESFGMALCEAMVCGCIPIISDIPALREVTDNQGYVLVQKDSDLLFDLVSKALKEYDPQVKLRINHIQKNYSKSNRKDKIEELFYSLDA